MMKELFPKQHVLGFLFSLVLTVVALAVLAFDMSYSMAMTLLIITAAAQAGVQLILFMHVGESEDKKTLYTNLAYALFVGVFTIVGSIFAMVWGYNLP